MSPNASVLDHPPAAPPPSDVHSCDLRAEVLSVGVSWSSAQYRLVHLVVDLDRSGQWAWDGSRTCARWVASALDIEVCTAREWLRIGRALEALPIIDTGFATRLLSYSKVRMLTRFATPDSEAELVDIAVRTPAGRLAREIARWLAGREEPDETERRLHEARSLTWHTDPDGMVVATLRLPPHVAAIPRTAIDTWIMQRTTTRRPVAASAGREPGIDTSPTATESAEDASADGRSARNVTSRGGGDGWPSIAQQRADGMVALLQGGGGLVDTEVVLHVRADGCTLDDGTPIAGTVVERIASTSFLRVLIHDAERRPINASGRHRHPTTRQKRVVHERDGGCVDCGSTELLQHDHDPDFAVSHRTLVDELRERCWTCHRARHRDEGRGRGRR